MAALAARAPTLTCEARSRTLGQGGMPERRRRRGPKGPKEGSRRPAALRSPMTATGADKYRRPRSGFRRTALPKIDGQPVAARLARP